MNILIPSNALLPAARNVRSQTLEKNDAFQALCPRCVVEGNAAVIR